MVFGTWRLHELAKVVSGLMLGDEVITDKNPLLLCRARSRKRSIKQLTNISVIARDLSTPEALSELENEGIDQHAGNTA